MKTIIPDLLYNFTGLIIGRVYAIKDPDGITLIDTGISLAGKRILKQLAGAGYAPNSVKRILITHAHPDHIGGLPYLVAQTGAEVICSSIEKPVIQGEIPIPRRPSGLRPPNTKAKPVMVGRTVDDGDVIPDVMGGLQAIHTGGHAPGHIAFWQPEREILFSGDVIFNLRKKMNLPWKMLTVDMEQNKLSVKKLVTLTPKMICFGHGDPVTENATGLLRDFANALT
ncbi:MAG: MBL fold metallo-hydrolase [Phototrophicales bacterium]|nr:MBL fold metallo-hydrolase [Phototrophicales bacterium]